MGDARARGRCPRDRVPDVDAQTAKLRARTRKQVVNCMRCPLHKTCSSPVPFSGPTPARIAVVGEAPGADEDEQRRPFVGRSGQLIRGLFRDVGLDADEMFIANSVSCRPPGNRTPTTVELTACRVNLSAQLEVAQPTFVVLLGATALSTVRPDLKVSAVHGRPFVDVHATQPLPPAYGRLPVWFPTFHPSAGLRDQGMRRMLEEDIAFFALLVKGGSWLEWWPRTCTKCGVEPAFKNAFDFLPFCVEHMPEQPPSLKIPQLVA